MTGGVGLRGRTWPRISVAARKSCSSGPTPTAATDSVDRAAAVFYYRVVSEPRNRRFIQQIASTERSLAERTMGGLPGFRNGNALFAFAPGMFYEEVIVATASKGSADFAVMLHEYRGEPFVSRICTWFNIGGILAPSRRVDTIECMHTVCAPLEKSIGNLHSCDSRPVGHRPNHG